MKKTLAIIALVAFLGGVSAPAIANSNNLTQAIELADKDPKKAKKAEKKSSECAEKKSSDCAEKKSSDCEKKCDGEKK